MEEKDLKNDASERSKPPEPKSDLDIMKAERDEYLNGWKRAKADLINYRQEDARRLEDMAKYGTESLIKEIISVIASFDFALQNLEKAGPVDKGLYMIKSQLEDILKRRGVEKIKVSVGDVFNPLYHEAIGMVEPTPTPQAGSGQAEILKSDTIAEEVDTGYTMHGRVIKVSKVKVVR